MLALGCSFTFGTGVNDQNTLPAQIENLSNGKIRTINLGVPGGGLAQASWIFSRRSKLAPEVANQSETWLLYTMLPDHIHRYSRSGPWALMLNPFDARMEFGSPRLYQAVAWALKFWPIFHAYRFLVGTSANLFYRSRIGRDYGTSEEIRTFVAGINALAAEYFQSARKGRFFLNVWTLEKSPAVDDAIRKVVAGIDKRISVVQYPHTQSLPRIRDLDNRPDHPTPAAYQKMANYLVELAIGGKE